MSGLDYHNWLELKLYKRRQMTSGRLVRNRKIADNYVMGVDMGAPGGDYTAYTLFRTPGRLRKFLRRIGLDRSTWEYKLVRTEIVKPTERILQWQKLSGNVQDVITSWTNTTRNLGVTNGTT